MIIYVYPEKIFREGEMQKDFEGLAAAENDMQSL